VEVLCGRWLMLGDFRQGFAESARIADLPWKPWWKRRSPTRKSGSGQVAERLKAHAWKACIR